MQNAIATTIRHLASRRGVNVDPHPQCLHNRKCLAKLNRLLPSFKVQHKSVADIRQLRKLNLRHLLLFANFPDRFADLRNCTRFNHNQILFSR